MDITLGTTQFPVTLSDGTRVVVRDADGWFKSPAPRSDSTVRVGGDGDFPALVTYGPRYVTLIGSVYAVTHAGLHEANMLLSGLLHSGPAELTVAGHGPTQSAMADRDGGLDWEDHTDTYAKWELSLKAPDPRKYGVLRTTAWTTASRTSPVSVQVSHEGNYPAAPVIEVKGSMTSGFTAWGTGADSFRSLETVNAGELFEVDFGSGLLRKDGAVVFGQTGYTNLAKVMPGVSRAANVIPATDGGVGQYRVLVRDTYI
ncbi:phage tail family protein [Zhihengliuella flava]|uniref:Uncharacterized protein n=1 Tax=Zhihengliuella flava TaxID=1285193 RepID=A0A931DFH1_9MICC|nr:phage tail family protein [Zhihengliuella flava]MBG6085808.1 hypothetical protein [Zhihengliuella flava]